MKRSVLLILGVCGLAWITSTSVPIWASDVTLWGHAIELTPEKPRAMLNYGVALAQAGRFQDATQAWSLSYQSADRAFVPAWERAEIKSAVPHNFAALSHFTQGLP